MSTMIQQIVEDFTTKVLETFCSERVLKLEEVEKELKEKTDDFILKTMQNYVEALDDAIVADKAGRKKKAIVIERREEKRELYTLFGQLRFKRTYFYNKRDDEYIYIADKAVGLEGYDRVSNTVAVKLADHACDVSYGKSSKYVTDGNVSRQTVMMKLRKMSELKVAEPIEKKLVKVLYVNADEDHVTLQDGTKTIVPLISIHEGIELRGKRGRCKNTRYISSHGKANEDLWLEASKYIYDSYDDEYLERIYLHGDGAKWISEGINWLPKAKKVLDKYHLNKAVIGVTGRAFDKQQALLAVLYKGDKKRYNKILKELKEAVCDEKQEKKLKEFKRYINNNWDAICIHSKEDCGGSCTEGHVSHILSSRLSSRPMGWSKDGLRIMAELRAFKNSGGHLTTYDFQSKERVEYKVSKKMRTMAKKAFTDALNERIGNITLLSRGKVMPIFGCLRGLRDGYEI